MAVVVTTARIDRSELPGLLAPRRDVLVEALEEDGTYASEHGPFSRYRREVTVEPVADDPSVVDVVETTSFRIAVPIWGLLFIWPIKRELRRLTGRQGGRAAPWAPPDMLDARSATVLGLLCSTALVAGYMGTVITQTITYAAEQFGSPKSAQADTLANVRIGVLIALGLVALADKRGRRGLLIFSAVASCLFTAATALSGSLLVLGTVQVVASGLTGTVILLITILAAEEMPAGSRTYAISVMTMTGALGAGMCLWALPLADTGPSGWRVLYVLALLGLPLMVHVSRRLPESRRFTAPHREATVVAGHARRFWVLGVSLFLISAFGAPASQLLNEFLRSERGFSAARISLFTMATSTPGVIGLVVGGRIADVRGRRAIVALGVVGGSILTVCSFASVGWPMWVWNVIGTILAAAAGPALAMYGPELFPTGSRARANGVIRVVSVAGSYAGLRIAGRLLDHGSLAHAMAVLAIGTVVVGGLVLAFFPETAHRELEDLNPEDRTEPAPPEPYETDAAPLDRPLPS